MRTYGSERRNEYALRIIRMYSALPKGEVARVIGTQVLRSGTSVGANFREGFRARSKVEYVAKIGLCLQERVRRNGLLAGIIS